MRMIMMELHFSHLGSVKISLWIVETTTAKYHPEKKPVKQVNIRTQISLFERISHTCHLRIN